MKTTEECEESPSYQNLSLVPPCSGNEATKSCDVTRHFVVVVVVIVVVVVVVVQTAVAHL